MSERQPRADGAEWRPEHDALVKDLKTLREKGLTRIRRLELSELTRAAVVAVDDDDADQAVAIEAVLREAVGRLGGGPYGDAAGLLFGLAGGTRGSGPTERRRQAAEELDSMSPETFRTAHQSDMVSDIATQVMAIVADQRRRHARDQLELRHPAESRLAVEWVERFEAYYRIWTPVYALGADLTAYRSTLLEEDRPYDRAPGTRGTDDPGYTQEQQAEGYARFALYRYATFELEISQFITRYGGLWLLSSHAAEKTIEDVIYQISWHVTPFNERDQSWLRGAVHDTHRYGVDGFLSLLASTSTGMRRHEEWQAWVATCSCTWAEGETPADEYFPSANTRETIDDACQVHRVVASCQDYCRTIDDEWDRIADWYHLGDVRRRPESPEALYSGWRDSGSPAVSTTNLRQERVAEWG